MHVSILVATSLLVDSNTFLLPFIFLLLLVESSYFTFKLPTNLPTILMNTAVLEVI